MPIFLMCSERSGSNLITKMMDAHRDICGPSPKHLFNPVVRNFFRYEPLDEPAHWGELLDDIDRLLGSDFAQWQCTFNRERLLQLAQPGDLRGLLTGVFQEEALAHGKQHYFVKENHIYEFITYLVAELPEARFVYQVRDPRDMALSWHESEAHAGGIVAAARQWKWDQQRFLRDHAVLRRASRSHRICFEDLVKRPREVLHGVTDFLGLRFDESMLAYHTNEWTRRNAATIDSWTNLGKPPIADKCGRYRQSLACDEIAVIERICGPEMNATGYVLDSSADALAAVDLARLDEWTAAECERLPSRRQKGVQANAEAKRVFYQKRLGTFAE